jgi:hypothetical protein
LGGGEDLKYGAGGAESGTAVACGSA